MLTNLHYLAITMFGFLAALFIVLSIILLFWHGKSGMTTKLGISLAILFSILGFTSITIAVIIYDKTMTAYTLMTLCVMVPLYGFMFVYYIGMRKVSKRVGANKALENLQEYFLNRKNR